MAVIRVDPPILFQSSGSIQNDAQGVETAGKGAHRSAEGAPSYDGQFGPKVKVIGSEALGRSGNLFGQLGGLSGDLSARGRAFESADNASAAGLAGLGVTGYLGLNGLLLMAKAGQWALLKTAILAWLRLGSLAFPSLLSTFALAGLGLTYLPKAMGLTVGGLFSKIAAPFGTIGNKVRDVWNWLFGAKKTGEQETALGKIMRGEVGKDEIVYKEKVTENLGSHERLVNQLMDFESSDAGKQLAADAVAAGLLFVVMDGNKPVARWGKKGGTEISIQYEKMKGAYGAYDPSNKEISLNTASRKDDHLYNHTLAHEMQHAVDLHAPNVDLSKMGAQIDGDMSVVEMETVLVEKYTEFAKTEVNAHDVGFDMENSETGEILDRNDGVYTKQEYDFIIHKRGYEQSYERYIDDSLDQVLGNGNYTSDVWVDDNGQIQVDIRQTQPIII